MVAATLPKGYDAMSEIQKTLRRVKVSSQRQVTIPKDFYESLNLDDEAIVEYTGKEIIIRPPSYEYVDFSTDILTDLVSEGYSGAELIERFTKLKADIPNALKQLEATAKNHPTYTDGSLSDYLDSLEDGDDE